MRTNKFENKNVLITGAASGIGRCLAERFAAARANLLLFDKDTKLHQIKEELERKYKVSVDILITDFTEPESGVEIATYDYPGKGFIADILINNAGIGNNNSIESTDFTTWRDLFEVNFFTPVKLNILMRHLNPNCHIVNIASGQVFFKLPTWGAYTATKAALAVISELLSIESKAPTTTVYPFMVNTGFYDKTKEEAKSFGTKMSMRLLPFYSQQPNTVAEKIMKAIENEKKVEMVHPINWVGYYLDTVPAVGYFFRLFVNKVIS